jgi:hypothetical protein
VTPELVILASARKHGIADEDVLHAYRYPIRIFDLEEGLRMIIGGDTSGKFLEVGYVIHDDLTLIVHAMLARDKFLKGM